MSTLPLIDRVAARQLDGDRSAQEDDYGLCEVDSGADGATDHFLLVLADGMGGHTGGARASGLAVRTFVETYQGHEGPVQKALCAALDASNAELARTVERLPALAGMGCTLVAAAVVDGTLAWISVGDSLLFLVRDGHLVRLNADHSMAPVLEDLVEAGQLTAEQAAADSRRSTLRSALTGDEIQLIDQSLEARPLMAGDRVLLASDGILTLDEAEIASIAGQRTAASLGDVADGLARAIEGKAVKGQDNTTFLLFEAGREDGAGERPAESAAAAQPAVSEAPEAGAGAHPEWAGRGDC